MKHTRINWSAASSNQNKADETYKLRQGQKQAHHSQEHRELSDSYHLLVIEPNGQESGNQSARGQASPIEGNPLRRGSGVNSFLRN